MNLGNKRTDTDTLSYLSKIGQQFSFIDFIKNK